MPATLKSPSKAAPTPPKAASSPPKRLRRSEKGCRQLSKAVSTPPGATETTPKKRGGFPRLPAPLKSRFNGPRGRRTGFEEARRISAVAGTTQKPLQRPPGPRKRLTRSEKGFRGCRQLSKAASTPPGTEETAPGKREGFPGSRHLSKAASLPAAPWRSVSQPALLPAHPRVILADHHTYRIVKEVNALKAVADREVI